MHRKRTKVICCLHTEQFTRCAFTPAGSSTFFSTGAGFAPVVFCARLLALSSASCTFNSTSNRFNSAHSSSISSSFRESLTKQRQRCEESVQTTGRSYRLRRAAPQPEGCGGRAAPRRSVPSPSRPLERRRRKKMVVSELTSSTQPSHSPEFRRKLIRGNGALIEAYKGE